MAGWRQALEEHTSLLMETLPSKEATDTRDALLTDLALEFSSSSEKGNETMAHVLRELQTAGSKRFFSHNKFGAKAPTFIDKLKPVTDWHTTDSNNDPHFLQATPKDIVGIIRNYYDFLYEDKPSDVTSANILLDELRGRKLPSQPRKTCEGDITSNELLAIMNKIPVNKSAGPDKIPGLFYKMFKT